MTQQPGKRAAVSLWEHGEYGLDHQWHVNLESAERYARPSAWTRLGVYPVAGCEIVAHKRKRSVYAPYPDELRDGRTYREEMAQIQ